MRAYSNIAAVELHHDNNSSFNQRRSFPCLRRARLLVPSTLAVAILCTSPWGVTGNDIVARLKNGQKWPNSEFKGKDLPLRVQPRHVSLQAHNERVTRRQKHHKRKRPNIFPEPSDMEISAAYAKLGDNQRTLKEESLSELPSPLLTSPWWVLIREEYGYKSYNFLPGSRRASSSVLFTLEYDKHQEEPDLLDEKDKAKKENSTIITNSNTNVSLPLVASHNLTASSSSNSTWNTNSTQLHAKDDSTSNTTTKPSIQEEYMIVSGGFTDHDWKTFPVYAFPITHSTQTGRGEWIDLSPSMADLKNGNYDSWCQSQDTVVVRDRLYQEATYWKSNETRVEDLWEHASPCPPSGRMGHSSVVYNNKLYVFGGLIYDEEQAPAGSRKKETFRLEDVPYVYRLDLLEMFEARDFGNERRRNVQENLSGGTSSLDDAIVNASSETASSTFRKVTGWQRIIPRVKQFQTLNGMPPVAASEVLLKSINRGEMQGGLWSYPGASDKFVMYGGLQISTFNYDGSGPHGPSKVMKGPDYSTSLSHKIVELPLGDIWAYDLVVDAWEKFTNAFGMPIDMDDDHSVKGPTIIVEEASNNDDDDDDRFWANLDATLYPRPRTAHAATIVGNELIIHGGMGWDNKENDWDGSTDWETLDDMWIFDLITRRWKRRWLFPLLVRSYHSLVGWNVRDSLTGWTKDFANYTSWEGPVVAAFGGYTTGIDVFSGEEVAYVFDDLLVSYPPPLNDVDVGVNSIWLKASMPTDTDSTFMISNRFEHVAVLSRNSGTMNVWGGQFQDTSNVKGMWMINVAGKDSHVRFSIAEADGIYDEYEATLTALHTIIIVMMFMSMTLTLLLGLTQRYNELLQQANDDATARGGETTTQDFGGEILPTRRRGRGLHPQIINTIPEKIYNSCENCDATMEQEEKDVCCPICLVDYEDGDELRVLPCNHYMHKSCVDAWLMNNPSCPSCRYSLSELVDDHPLMQLRTLRSRISSQSSAFARFLSSHDSSMVFVPAFSHMNSRREGSDGNDGIEMIADFGDGSGLRRSVIDLRYVSSLALSEDDTEGNASEERNQRVDLAENVPNYDSSLSEVSSRNRRSQRERTSRLAGLRRNVAGIRRNLREVRDGTRAIPLTDPLEDESERTIV